jgi:hypothetical protein
LNSRRIIALQHQSRLRKSADGLIFHGGAPLKVAFP